MFLARPACSVFPLLRALPTPTPERPGTSTRMGGRTRCSLPSPPPPRKTGRSSSTPCRCMPQRGTCCRQGHCHGQGGVSQVEILPHGEWSQGGGRGRQGHAACPSCVTREHRGSVGFAAPTGAAEQTSDRSRMWQRISMRQLALLLILLLLEPTLGLLDNQWPGSCVLSPPPHLALCRTGRRSSTRSSSGRAP